MKFTQFICMSLFTCLIISSSSSGMKKKKQPLSKKDALRNVQKIIDHSSTIGDFTTIKLHINRFSNEFDISVYNTLKALKKINSYGFMNACSNGNHKYTHDIIEFYLFHGENPLHKDEKGQNVLYYACLGDCEAYQKHYQRECAIEQGNIKNIKQIFEWPLKLAKMLPQEKIIIFKNLDPTASQKIFTFTCCTMLLSKTLKVKIPKPILFIIIALFLEAPDDTLMNYIWSSSNPEEAAQEAVIEMLTQTSRYGWNPANTEGVSPHKWYTTKEHALDRNHAKIVKYIEYMREKLNILDDK